MKNPIFWIDIETSGLNPAINSVIEVFGFLQRGARLNLLARPVEDDYLVESTALEVNGRTLEEIKRFPLPTKAVEELIERLMPIALLHGKITMAGYNVPFDHMFLGSMFWREQRSCEFSRIFSHRMLDVASLVAMFVDSGFLSVESQSLEHVAQCLGVDHVPHKAESDCMAAKGIYDILIDWIRDGGMSSGPVKTRGAA